MFDVCVNNWDEYFNSLQRLALKMDRIVVEIGDGFKRCLVSLYHMEKENHHNIGRTKRTEHIPQAFKIILLGPFKFGEWKTP